MRAAETGLLVFYRGASNMDVAKHLEKWEKT